MPLLERRPRIAEVAARAGVSTATVDRVMNSRGGVRRDTVERVEQAILQMTGPRVASVAKNGNARRFDAVLAGDGSMVTKNLGDAMIAAGAAAGAQMAVSFVERMNPTALAARLEECARSGTSGVAVQALDHVLVAEALDKLSAADVPVVTVLTDMATINRVAYVGLDNRAAGRTAGYLMGRFCRAAGKLAVVWGGQLYRSHEERESGFRNVLRFERPDLQCLEVITSNDDPAEAHDKTTAVIARHRDLAGIYCVGGGVTGVAEAIEETGLARRLVMIGHNCNSQTKPFLLSGTIDAVIHQDTTAIAERAVRALFDGRNASGDAGIPIDIVTRENLMHR